MNREVDPLMLIGAGVIVVILVAFFAWHAFAPDSRAQVSTTQLAQHQTQTFNQQAGIAAQPWASKNQKSWHFH